MTRQGFITNTLALAAMLTVASFAARADNLLTADAIKASEASVTVSSVSADQDGYLVVHRTDFTGTLPGSVVGHAAVKAGANADVTISIDPKAKAGEKLIVMLHAEGNGDTVFDAADKPVTGAAGPVQQIVTVQ